jgi:hypothetical protein
MPFSRRPVSFDALLIGEILLGALLLAGPARADDDDDDGRLSAREVMEEIHDEARDRARWMFGDDDDHDPVYARPGRGDRTGSFDNPDQARRLVAEEILDRLEARLNEGRWIPFRNEERKERKERKERRERSGPEILFGLEDPTAQAPVLADPWTSRFRVSLMRGLEYKQEFDTRNPRRKLEMRVFGPVVPNGPGLGVQLKGHVLERRFRMNAYGTGDEAGLTLDLEF